ncbi:hypothetical protein ISU53_15215 (plasmid) [Enterococcus faecium]|uniref:hypothetical protein n=1 Tax=Enterococcus faecium TaxID=1352 RepID=UPI0018D3900E|nr:hypothetical protein [Enterococcus faecium]QPQ20040.1 hypothetical protein ISU53_15215 [Enterococcus faecium]
MKNRSFAILVLSVILLDILLITLALKTLNLVTSFVIIPVIIGMSIYFIKKNKQFLNEITGENNHSKLLIKTNQLLF